MQARLGRDEGSLGREIRAVGQRETLDAFDNVGAAGKSARRKARRQQSVLRRLAGVERLAHRPELRFEPGRLCPGNADRRCGCLGIETEEPGAGRRGAERTDRPGRVKTEVVVPRLQRGADATGRLISRDKGGDDLTP